MKLKNIILSITLTANVFLISSSLNAQDIAPIAQILSQNFEQGSTIETAKDIGKGTIIINVGTYDWDEKNFDLQLQINPSVEPVRIIKTLNEFEQESYRVEVPENFPEYLGAPTVSSEGGYLQITFGNWNIFSELKTRIRFVGKNSEAGKISEWVSTLRTFEPEVIYQEPLDLLTLIEATGETAKTEIFLNQFFKTVFTSFPQNGLISISVKYMYQPTDEISTSVPVTLLPATTNRLKLAQILGETIKKWEAQYSPAPNGKYIFTIHMTTDTDSFKTNMMIENLMLNRNNIMD
jgi:hypothetical protein